MGFFDKKSRLLRKKMKDLHAELRVAEKEGRFEVKDGVFFAKLQMMGDQTMMAFAGMDALNPREDDVIRQFFQRNGFAVENVKIDSKAGHLAEILVEPPEEMILSMGRDLKSDGYRMVDDSEKGPRPVNLEEGVFPLSALLDIATAHFAGKVRAIIASTEIKQNKEGARLIKWMPEISAYFEKKHGAKALEAARDAFERAFGKLYSGAVFPPKDDISQNERLDQVRKVREAEALRAHQAKQHHPTGQGPSPVQRQPSAERPMAGGGVSAQSPLGQAPTGPRPALPQRPPSIAAASPAEASARGLGGDQSLQLRREAKFRGAMAEIYKGLVRANASRCVRNATGILEKLIALFDATAACVLAKQHGNDSMGLLAQAGSEMQWGGKGGGLPISASIVSECLKERRVVSRSEGDGGGDVSTSMLANSITATMAAPLIVDGDVAGVLYIDRRRGLLQFTEADLAMLGEASRVFQEFPDLTLGTL